MMKELFGANITTNKNNRVCDGEEAVTKRQEGALKNKKTAYDEAVLTQIQKIRLPGVLAFARIVALIAGVICAAASLFLSGALKHVTGWSGVALCVCAAALTIVESMRASGFSFGVQAKGLERVGCILENETAMRLGVPANAKQVDVFVYTYMNGKNGNKIAIKDKIINTPMSVFVDNDRLCFFDGEKRRDILIAGIKSIEKVEEKTVVFGWNRSDKFNEELYPYKKFKIKADEVTGELTLKYYYKMVFIAANNEYCLRFPPYEGETIRQLTGCTFSDE